MSLYSKIFLFFFHFSSQIIHSEITPMLGLNKSQSCKVKLFLTFCDEVQFMHELFLFLKAENNRKMATKRNTFFFCCFSINLFV